MYSLVITGMSLIAASLVVTGLAMELKPAAFKKGVYQTWLTPALVTNVLFFIGGMIALVVLGAQQALAAEAAVAPDLIHTSASVGLGMELFAIGVPTLGSVLAAGIAVARIGAAGLAVVAEKPEIFGRTLIYLGLAEGLAIYGLVLSILMMGKL